MKRGTLEKQTRDKTAQGWEDSRALEVCRSESDSQLAPPLRTALLPEHQLSPIIVRDPSL